MAQPRETPKRLAPTVEVAKRLFALSGNRCAFRDCEAAIFDVNGVLVAELCHIEAAEPGGERFNKHMTNDQRRAISNLMLMCHKHHKITDDVEVYTLEVMRAIKAEHEAKYSEAAQKIIDYGFVDVTETDVPEPARTLDRYKRTYDLTDSDAEGLSEWFSDYAERLAKVPKEDRKLLSIFVRRDAEGIVRHSELRKLTRSTNEEIVDSLRLMEKYKLLIVDVDEDDRNPPIRLRYNGDYEHSPAERIRDFAQRESIALEEFLVEMRFNLLD